MDVYLSVRLEAGTLHLANYLIRATVYYLDAKVVIIIKTTKPSCTPKWNSVNVDYNSSPSERL